jgi:hypothetical protein
MSRFASFSERGDVLSVAFVLAVRRVALLMCLGVGARAIGAQPVHPTPTIPTGSRTTWASVQQRENLWHVGPQPASAGAEARPATLAIPTSGLVSETAFDGVSPWYAPPLSALVPGLGQGLLRQQRGIVYLAAEGYLILRALGAQRDARRERDAYREIARTVARAGFGADRPDASWEYYERLQHVLESGAFNTTPGAALSPETDPATFNGSIWRLARETFWRDPDVAPDPTSGEYQRALAFYERRAVGESFRWSWRDAQLEQDLYRQTIDRSNDASRQARQMVGLLLANHALSLVDAYVSVRLRVFGDTDGGTRRVGMAGQLPLPAGLR